MPFVLWCDLYWPDHMIPWYILLYIYGKYFIMCRTTKACGKTAHQSHCMACRTRSRSNAEVQKLVHLLISCCKGHNVKIRFKKCSHSYLYPAKILCIQPYTLELTHRPNLLKKRLKWMKCYLFTKKHPLEMLL